MEKQHRADTTITRDMNHDYHREIFENRESMKTRGKYAKEKMIDALISQGEVERVQEILQPAMDGQIGRMSRNPFRQQLYAIIIGIAIATRAAMDGGLSEEEAYTLSDLYIREADACNSTQLLWELYARVVLDFTERVRKEKSNAQISETIQNAMDYILRHLHYDVNLKDIADSVGLSETYFSALFKKETGTTVSEFIQKSRVKEAASMLQYSEYGLQEIGQYLGFCSQSHFSKTFRRYTGMTPGQYRKKYFKRIW